MKASASRTAPPVCDLLLVGGGHSHIQVLKAFGMKPVQGVRVTMLSREAHSPYSGMLPGYVAGRYSWDDMHIDLGPLCRFAGARLIHDEAVALDLDRFAVHCRKRPPLRFDLLSINCGAAPEALPDVGAPVKPISRFLPAWDALQARIQPGERLVFVGGGAGGLELALAARRTLPADVGIEVVAAELLPGQSAAAKRLALRELASKDIRVASGKAVAGQPGVLHLQGGGAVRFDHLFWVTGVTAPAWVRDSALATDEQGFIRVDRLLRSVSHAQVYAAGDIAHLTGRDLPKSGVYAVRAGPVLAGNLRHAAAGIAAGAGVRQRTSKARPFRPQRRTLSLMGTGDGRAIACRGRFAAAGRWAWRWKHWIDRRFIDRYRDLPAADNNEAALEQAGGLATMRCGGCGAKLSADVLQRALAKLPPQTSPALVQGIGDDAAVLAANPAPLVLTMDGFRSLVDDPYRFGRITAHHCLNDIYAMGATPTSAMALATVSLMADGLMEDELHQLLAGAVAVLNDEHVPLVGGHSAEGAELSLGLSITGALTEAALRKDGAAPGDRLILTKPLGVGVLFAAHMRGLARTADVQAALARLDLSNRSALEVLRAHQVRAATDITGFGLVGHLAEMLDAAGLGAELWLERVVALNGALPALQAGAASVLQAHNERALGLFEIRGCSLGDPKVRLLADPQTAGGLLACVPEDRAAACLKTLRAAGYAGCAEVGVITERDRLILAQRPAR